MPKFRKGDRVTIEATVEGSFSLGDDELRIKIDDMWGSGPHYYAKLNDLTLKVAQFEIGDLIDWTFRDTIYRGEILAISNEHAWVDRGDGQYSTIWLSNATRVDDEPEETSEAA